MLGLICSCRQGDGFFFDIPYCLLSILQKIDKHLLYLTAVDMHCIFSLLNIEAEIGFGEELAKVGD